MRNVILLTALAVALTACKPAPEQKLCDNWHAISGFVQRPGHFAWDHVSFVICVEDDRKVQRHALDR